MDNSELIQFANSMKIKSTDELLSIWLENKKQDFPEGAFKIIRQELINRGVKLPKQKTAEDVIVEADFGKDVGVPFFPTSPKKLIVMSLCTFGIYEIFWFYKNWKFLKEKHNLKVSPFARAVFSIFYCHSFFKIVKEYSKQHQIQSDYKPATLTAGFILLNILYKLPDPFGLVSFLSFIPLLPVQKTINVLKDTLVPEAEINSKFSGWNIVGIIFGVLWWAAMILGFLVPAPEA